MENSKVPGIMLGIAAAVKENEQASLAFWRLMSICEQRRRNMAKSELYSASDDVGVMTAAQSFYEALSSQ
jgi:hypothetical protein